MTDEYNSDNENQLYEQTRLQERSIYLERSRQLHHRINSMSESEFDRFTKISGWEQDMDYVVISNDAGPDVTRIAFDHRIEGDNLTKLLDSDNNLNEILKEVVESLIKKE